MGCMQQTLLLKLGGWPQPAIPRARPWMAFDSPLPHAQGTVNMCWVNAGWEGVQPPPGVRKLAFMAFISLAKQPPVQVTHPRTGGKAAVDGPLQAPPCPGLWAGRRAQA